MPVSTMDELGKTVLIGSGAIGTSLRQSGTKNDEPVELINLRQPEAVLNLHRAYRDAGAQILVTNTFAANKIIFGDNNIEDLCDETNRVAVALAREAGESQCLIWASIGPLGLGLRIEDYRDDALVNIYRSQCRKLLEADALLLETFVDPREAKAALQAAAETGLPVIFQMGNLGGGLRRWDRVDQLLNEALRSGAIAVGANCSHPDDIIRLITYIGDHTHLPITVSPNAGHPRIERGVVKYEFTPDDFAAIAGKLADSGAAVIGGCCGTTPDHIRLAAAAVGQRTVKARTHSRATLKSVEAAVQPAVPGANRIREMMESQRFIISVEIRADRHQSLDDIVAGAEKVASAGADMFDVPDNAGATVGRDAMVTAAKLQDVLKIPSICHFSVTQSNMMRLHSTLIGCWDSGLTGLLAVTGDAPSMGHLGNLAHRIVDMRSSVELLRLIRELRLGKIINGEGLADPPDFCTGCAIGRPIPAQTRWLEKKIEAGAEFVFSQPIFTFDDFRRLRDALAGFQIRLFPGIMPLSSHRNASFLAAGRIPGIVVPEHIVNGFKHYASTEDQRRYGLDQALELAASIAAESSGLYLIMPFGKRCYEDAARIVKQVKEQTN